MLFIHSEYDKKHALQMSIAPWAGETDDAASADSAGVRGSKEVIIKARPQRRLGWDQPTSCQCSQSFERECNIIEWG